MEVLLLSQMVDDDFSSLANLYADYRPTYPHELFQFLASISPSRQLAWDCATGNGQAAIALTSHFQTVRASDASFAQVAHGNRRSGVFFIVEKVEFSALPNHSVDLITVAQAIHWFDLPRFYQEVRRVLKPEGILAAWCYQIPKIFPEIDQLLEWYFQEVLGPYWSPGIFHVAEGYRNLPFPLLNVATPPFKMEISWNLKQLIGFLVSWSATKKFLNQRGYHPISEIQPALTKAWGHPQDKMNLDFPLWIRAGVSVPEPS